MGRRRVAPPQDKCYFCEPSQTVAFSYVVRALSALYIQDVSIYEDALAVASKQFGNRLRPAVRCYLQKAAPGLCISARGSLVAFAIEKLLSDIACFPDLEQQLKDDGRALLAARRLCEGDVFLNVASYLVREPAADLERTKKISYTLARHPEMKAELGFELEDVHARSYALAVEQHCKHLIRLQRLIEHVLRLACPLGVASLQRARDMIGRILKEPRLVRYSFCHKNFSPLCSP